MGVGGGWDTTTGGGLLDWFIFSEGNGVNGQSNPQIVLPSKYHLSFARFFPGTLGYLLEVIGLGLDQSIVGACSQGDRLTCIKTGPTPSPFS